MTESIPPWLATMRAITGLTEYDNGSNPKIEAMAQFVGQKFPEQKSYATNYTDDSIAWCGVCVAYCMATADIEGPFGPTDTDKWMWAQAWADTADGPYVKLAGPALGCIVVMTREGGGHVTMYESDDGDYIKCRGGNQSDSVNVSSYAKDTVIGYMWPSAVRPPPVQRSTISEGDQGQDVMEVQRILGLQMDGDFGPTTDAGVKQYQGAYGLSKDGEVGPATWDALDELDAKMKAGSDSISEQLAQEIEELCDSSPLNVFSWDDRGTAPEGYYAGMAKCFAWALQRPEHDAVVVMSEAASHSEYDALNVYRNQLEDEELDVSEDGDETLRALFVMMVGLGMRESSGNHWEGRDLSASNVESDTCEAGLFQTSWNISTADSSIPPLLAQFWADPNGFRPTFSMGLTPTANNLDAYGSGDGARYQFLSKFTPNFSLLVTGVGMRKRCNHWGPINRGEVQIVSMVNDLLLDVQQLVLSSEPVPPERPERPPVQPPDRPPIQPPERPPEQEAARVDVYVRSEGHVVVTVHQEPQGQTYALVDAGPAREAASAEAPAPAKKRRGPKPKKR